MAIVELNGRSTTSKVVALRMVGGVDSIILRLLVGGLSFFKRGSSFFHSDKFVQACFKVHLA